MALRTDLNGLRVKSPAWKADAIYLIDEGKRRHIPDPPTYDNLFRDWQGVIVDININEIDLGVPIVSGAYLIRGYNDPKVFLFEPGKNKRWINSPDAMSRYYFNWGKIQPVDPNLLANVPNGPDITA